MKCKGAFLLFCFLGAEEGGLDLGNTGSSLGVADLGSVPSLLVDGLLDLSLGSGVSSDGSVGLGVHLLDVLGVDAGLDESRELSLESFLVLLLELLHVVTNVATEDVVFVDLSVELAVGESGESLGAVGDVETSISGTLEDTEDSGTSGGSGQTSVQVASEGSLLAGVSLLVELVSVDLDLAFVHGVKTELLEDSSADQETDGVGSGVVGQTDGDAVSWEFVGIGGGDDDVSLEPGVGDLSDDVLVGDSDDKSVLRGVVLVLVLDTESLSGEVVGLSLSSSLELGLVSLEVGLVLLDLDEGSLRTSASFLGHVGLESIQQRSVRQSKSDSKMG